MLSSDWRLGDDAGATVLEMAQGKDDGRRLSFRGDPHRAPDVIVLLATAFHVLMSASLLGGGGGGP